MRTHVEIFAGIGMMSVAAERLSYETVVAIENDDFCRRVLVKRFPGTTILGDVKEVTGTQLLQAVADRRRTAGGDAGGSQIDLMSMGFP